MREKVHNSLNPEEPLNEDTLVELPGEINLVEWDLACGGRKKSRTYGFGSLLDHVDSCERTLSSSSSSSSSRYVRRGSSLTNAFRSQFERTMPTEECLKDKARIIELEEQQQQQFMKSQQQIQQLQEQLEQQQTSQQQQTQLLNHLLLHLNIHLDILSIFPGAGVSQQPFQKDSRDDVDDNNEAT